MFRCCIFCLLTIFPVLANADDVEIVGAAIALDGDTLSFVDPFDPADDVTVRIFGIDTPEMKEQRGWIARAHMDALIHGQRVRCTVIEKDRYGRSVSICRVNDVDLAEVMLRQGVAVTYRKFLLRDANLQTYMQAEAEAIEAKVGFWRDAGGGF